MLTNLPIDAYKPTHLALWTNILTTSNREHPTCMELELQPAQRYFFPKGTEGQIVTWPAASCCFPYRENQALSFPLIIQLRIKMRPRLQFHCPHETVNSTQAKHRHGRFPVSLWISQFEELCSSLCVSSTVIKVREEIAVGNLGLKLKNLSQKERILKSVFFLFVGSRQIDLCFLWFYVFFFFFYHNS